MNKESLEHLSSLMDGELSRETSLFMARRLSSDGELSGTWKRYHLIRDCIRQPGGRTAVFDLSERMRSALESEPGQAAQAVPATRWLRPLTAAAIAASVALMAVLLVGPGQVAGPQGAKGADTAGADSFSSPNVLPAVPLSAPASYSGDRDTERRLNSYLLRHNQLAGSVGRQGFVSFVPIIAETAADPDSSEVASRGQQAGVQADPESNAKP